MKYHIYKQHNDRQIFIVRRVCAYKRCVRNEVRTLPTYLEFHDIPTCVCVWSIYHAVYSWVLRLVVRRRGKVLRVVIYQSRGIYRGASLSHRQFSRIEATPNFILSWFLWTFFWKITVNQIINHRSFLWEIKIYNIHFVRFLDKYTTANSLLGI